MGVGLTNAVVRKLSHVKLSVKISLLPDLKFFSEFILGNNGHIYWKQVQVSNSFYPLDQSYTTILLEDDYITAPLQNMEENLSGTTLRRQVVRIIQEISSTLMSVH